MHLVNRADLGQIAHKEYNTVSQWKRSTMLLMRQLYRAKFIFGDAIEQVDPMADKDNAGDLHVDDIPAELLEQVVAGEEDLAARLKTAEGVIRKLYSRSMELTQENSALKEENERLKELARPRPHSSQGHHGCSRPSSARADSRLARKQKTEAEARAEVEAAGEKREKGEEREGAKSAPLEPTEVWKLKAAAKKSEQEEAAALEALAPGEGTQQRLRMLEEELRQSRRREELARAEVGRMRKLEILMWEGATPNSAAPSSQSSGWEVVTQLRARLESARVMLGVLAEQLSHSTEDAIRLKAAAAADKAMHTSRLKHYLRHRSALLATLSLLLQRFPAKASRPRPSTAEREKAAQGLHAMAEEQQHVIEQLRTNSAAIGELSNMMIGGREEAEEEAASEEEEEEETDKAFTTSSLVRSVELVALQMSAEARAELLAMMQDLFHRFHLVKMETDAQAETERELRSAAETQLRQLLDRKSVV